MVGKIFKVTFTRKAQNRRKQIFDFEQRKGSKTHAQKVDYQIIKSAKKLKKLPESRPILPETEGEESDIRYTKAFSYKIIFKILKKAREVLVVTIRHDREDLEDIKKSL